jgi:Uma2 family endonuclease
MASNLSNLAFQEDDEYDSPRRPQRGPELVLRRYSYEDYKDWPLAPGERNELIHGKFYAMAAPSEKHQAVSMELSRQIAAFLYEKPCKVRAAPYDVRLFYKADGTDDTVVQPDLVVICDEKKRGPEGCRGAPDIVIEILLPSNTREEIERKRGLYREAGVPEYWEFDLASRQVCVRRIEKGAYTERHYAAGGLSEASSAVLPALTLNLDAVFAA